MIDQQPQPDYNIWPSQTPIYSTEQIDQMILTPASHSNAITKKKPNMVRKPIYLLDEKGEKVPLQDEAGNILTNAEGEIKYIIKDWVVVQEGWVAVAEMVPASELFTIDFATSNIGPKAVEVLLEIQFLYNYYQLKHQKTGVDYSYYLHKLRNDALSILQAGKSLNGSTVQAVKTFTNRTDQKQWINDQMQKQNQNPLALLFGGKKKAAPEEKEHTAYS